MYKKYFQTYLKLYNFIKIIMPPKRAPVAKKVQKPVSESEESDEEVEVTPVVQTQTVSHVKVTKPTVSVTYNPNDSDRVQLAQAINNLTVKGEQFVSALNSFSKFSEIVTELDIQIETKKRHYKDMNDKLEKEWKDKVARLEKEEEEKTRQYKLHDVEQKRNLENELKNQKIENDQKLRQYKLKGCEDVVKEFNMMVIKTEDYKSLQDTIAKVNRELEELRKKFDTNCDTIKKEERGRFEGILKSQEKTQELNFKAATAEMKAQVDQQKKEVEMLNKTIDTLKAEIVAQRELTQAVANAGAKSQITQQFSKQ